ncbi:hypothetical protein [Mycobacterium paraffinicum]|uniref:hypothetical protein n=1 Tax=Mycobacterium paraffinicum TaxID=53378 RepID=UPI0021F396D0|nr:hypothetical protein [Mycobacterium paraffinicum]
MSTNEIASAYPPQFVGPPCRDVKWLFLMSFPADKKRNRIYLRVRKPPRIDEP